MIVMLAAIICGRSGAASAAESYPVFDRDYWVHEQELAQGKINRGLGLGVVGLGLIWPTSVIISKTTQNPQKYWALSTVFAMASIGATLHGFGSVGFGRQQKNTAGEFVAAYDADPQTVDISSEQSDYLHAKRKTNRKTMVFGGYLSTVGAVLLSNGIVQSVRKHRGAQMDDIRVWPYYLAGGLLIPLGVAIMVRSQKKLRDLDALEASTPPAQTTVIAPFVQSSLNGSPVWGVSFSSHFSI
ncbi:MAG: hypothetical protein JXR45_09045 [Deltaproteobacteria bacterium]|nr:hypothetical protein [Deltaproteobacteria bacterium]